MSSVRRSRGRKRAVCSGVPHARIVGPISSSVMPIASCAGRRGVAALLPGEGPGVGGRQPARRRARAPSRSRRSRRRPCAGARRGPRRAAPARPRTSGCGRSATESEPSPHTRSTRSGRSSALAASHCPGAVDELLERRCVGRRAGGGAHASSFPGTVVVAAVSRAHRSSALPAGLRTDVRDADEALGQLEPGQLGGCRGTQIFVGHAVLAGVERDDGDDLLARRSLGRPGEPADLLVAPPRACRRPRRRSRGAGWRVA